ncbi:MAG TPA: FAD-dependent oxidoreductase [Polyangiales bacterium]|nr:FAD-dependent oxidoreductase [Polyangiales bacterium]
MQNIVIVGASLAGLRAAEALRKRGYAGRLTLVGDELHAPYDRPPLSKQLLTGEWDQSRVFFRQKEGFAGLDLQLVLGRRAQQLDARARRVTLDDGSALDYEGLVIATGARARTLPLGAGLSGIHVLRTLDDSLAIHAALAQRPRVLVVGAGFIGLEVAAACRKLDLQVTVIEAESAPLVRSLGARVGNALVDMHRARGVDLRVSTGLSALEGHGRVERARLSDGSALEVDLVVVGVGVVPETDWLQGSGVALGNGVICDEHCATNVPGVVAAGDAACAPNTLLGETLRVEHWANAIEQAQLAAGQLLGDTSPPRVLGQVPYFWSDQYELKFQCAGRVRPDDELALIEGSLDAPGYVALFGRAGVLTGVLACNRPGPLIKYRRAISERTTLEAALRAMQPADPTQ